MAQAPPGHGDFRALRDGGVFVGRRKDPLVVNLGGTFDLVNIEYPAVELQRLAEFATVDNVQGSIRRPRAATTCTCRASARR
jgi:hypothetical protein